MVSALGDKLAENYIASTPKLYKNWAKQIVDEKPDILGLSILISNIEASALIAKEVKRLSPKTIILSGGPSLTRENKNTLEEAYKFSDYILEGEGEAAIVEFVRCLQMNGDVRKVKQLWLQEPDGSLTHTGHGIEQDINKIPLPDFTDFDRSKYPCPDKLPMLFSRGCILNCNYCENKWNHLTQRSRTGENVFNELKRNVYEYGIKEYMFNDDSLISFKTFTELEDYCDRVLAEDLVLPWGVYGTRVERKLTEAYVRKLRKSGMNQVSLGVESFSSKIQREMGKSSKYDDADKTCRLFADNGIKTEAWIIYGYPTETDKDFDDTLNWFVKNPGVLSHVTANSFGPNAKYHTDKPGMVTYQVNEPWWTWHGSDSSIQKRRDRFLRLMEVLESIRVSRNGKFSFHVGDPHYVKYFKTWTVRDKAFLFEKWAEHEPLGYQPNWIFSLLVRSGIKKPTWSEGENPLKKEKPNKEGYSDVHADLLQEIIEYLERKDPKKNNNVIIRRLELKLKQIVTKAEDDRIEKRKLIELVGGSKANMDNLIQSILELTEEEILEMVRSTKAEECEASRDSELLKSN